MPPPLLCDSYDPRYAEIISGHATPDQASLPDVEDDDNDPNYARINNFRQPPSPQTFISRTPSPAAPAAVSNQPQTYSDELDGLYAKVNKSRPPPPLQNQHQTQADRWERRGRRFIALKLWRGPSISWFCLDFVLYCHAYASFFPNACAAFASEVLFRYTRLCVGLYTQGHGPWLDQHEWGSICTYLHSWSAKPGRMHKTWVHTYTVVTHSYMHTHTHLYSNVMNDLCKSSVVFAIILTFVNL